MVSTVLVTVVGIILAFVFKDWQWSAVSVELMLIYKHHRNAQP